MVVGILLSGFAPLYASSPLRPIAKINSESLKLVEGQLYCKGGYGSQNNQFKFGGKTVHSHRSSSVIIPEFDIVENVMAGFGCQIGHVFFDYSLNSGSTKLNDEVTENGTLYNTVKYEVSYYNLGYQFTLIPHLLYAGAGVGYYELNYTLGMYGGSLSSEYAAESKRDDGFGGVAKLQWFLNHFFFISYKYQKSFLSDETLNSSSQFGLNFYSRF